MDAPRPARVTGSVRSRCLPPTTVIGDDRPPCLPEVTPGTPIDVGGEPGPVTFSSGNSIEQRLAFEDQGRTVVNVPLLVDGDGRPLTGELTVSRRGTPIRTLRLVVPESAPLGEGMGAFLDAVQDRIDHPRAARNAQDAELMEQSRDNLTAPSSSARRPGP